jgi:tellurium resistance protein TerD
MSFNLSKGETFDIAKAAPGLTKVAAGAGWDVKTGGPSMDLDLCAFLVDENGKMSDAKQFVYFNNKKSPCGSVASRGDNLTGAGEGDDEVLDIDLSAVPAAVKKIVIAVSIYNAKSKGQSLKSLDNAFVRIVDATNQTELTKYDLTNFDNAEANFVLGELTRNDSGWGFTAIGEPKAGELGELAQSYSQAA